MSGENTAYGRLSTVRCGHSLRPYLGVAPGDMTTPFLQSSLSREQRTQQVTGCQVSNYVPEEFTPWSRRGTECDGTRVQLPQDVLTSCVPTNKLHYGRVEHLCGLDVHRVSGIGTDDLQPRDRTRGEFPVGRKALLPFAADEERGDLQSTHPLTYREVGRGVAQGLGNATGVVVLRISDQSSLDG